MDHLAKVYVAADTDEKPVLKYIRGILERGLRPETLWPRATTGTHHMFGRVSAASSSSSALVPTSPVAAAVNFRMGEIEALRASDIEDYREFFLGPPGPLFAALPAARPFSKLMNRQPKGSTYPSLVSKAASVAPRSSLV